MYQFETAAQEAAFRAALDAEALQHISGRIFDASGTELTVDDSTIVDDLAIDSRCLEDEEIFNIADMYVGELTMRIHNDTVRAVELIGGEVRLSFGVDTTLGRITIPLGVWDIVDAKRDNAHFVSLTGHDHMGRLAVPIGIDDVGIISLSTVLTTLEEKANIQFAQTANEIKAMAVSGVTGNCTKWEETCWQEVRLIAQMIGGFAFANRDGEIEFRRFQNYSNESTLRIPANRRFRAELQERSYGVKSVAYTDTYGKTYEAHTTVSLESSAIISIPRNKWIWTAPSHDSEESYYEDICFDFLYNLDFDVVPGNIEFYGDPSIDLGDIVILTGGIGDDSDFLVTGSCWQFRAPHTLSCGGAPKVGEYVTSSNSTGSGAVPVAVGTSITKNINVAELTPYLGALFPSKRTVARARFGCKNATTAFLECELVILGTETSAIKVFVYLDNYKQIIEPKTTAHKGRYTTLSFAYSASVKDGLHNVEIAASGKSELVEVNGCVWGQNITSEELTYNSDYTYTISEGEATVTGYTGESLHLEIPEELGGAPVKVIGGTSFTNSDAVTAYIPDGVTEIADSSSSATIVKEKTSSLPMTFHSDGTSLLDWSITGAAGGVGVLGRNYLKQEEKTFPDGSYGARLSESSWISSRTVTFNSGSAKNIALCFRKNDNSAVSPTDIGTIVISATGRDDISPSIYQGLPVSIYIRDSQRYVVPAGYDALGNSIIYNSDNERYISIRCRCNPITIEGNTTYVITRTGGDEGVDILYYLCDAPGTISIAWQLVNAKSIPGNETPDKNTEQWARVQVTNYVPQSFGQDTQIDSRMIFYENCPYTATLPAGHWKVIAERLETTYVRSAILDDTTPYMALLKSDDTAIINKTNLFQNNNNVFAHEEYDFTLSAETTVGLYFKMLHSDGYPAYIRFMIVDYDMQAESFTSTIDGSSFTGVTCWEPYHVDLPLTITSGAQSTTVTIDLGDSPLGVGDTIDYTTTEISIPTYEGSNTITAGTTVQPSSMYIKYEDDESSVGAFMNATDLAYVSIPESVELIGRNAFTNTSLTKVRISRDCVFYPTSFPVNCDIWYYDEVPTPDNYYTAAQVNSLISALDARISALENENM